jgi:large subunit ribosomal protein L7/L12
MRKKCTNSSCRRTFTVEAVNKVSCPYCGRVYPRIPPALATGSVQTNWSVVLYSTSQRKLPTVKVIRALTGLGLKAAKSLVDNAPSVVRTGLSCTEAFRMDRELKKTGASAAAKRLRNREKQYFYTV